MSYPGDPNLDQKIMQRILSAFGEAVRLYQEGNPEECRTILRSILEVDPSFSPGARLMQAVEKGSSVDLGQLLGEVGAADGLDTEASLIEARQAFAERDYRRVQELAAEILAELPGEEEAKRLSEEAAQRLRSADQVERYVGNARKAMSDGSIREVESFLELARGLDPSHPGIAELEIELSGGVAGTGERSMEFDFDPGVASGQPIGQPPADLFTVEEDLDDSTLSRRRAVPADQPVADAPPAPASDTAAAATETPPPPDDQEEMDETIVAPAALRPVSPSEVADETEAYDEAELEEVAPATPLPGPPATDEASGFEFASGGVDQPPTAEASGFAFDEPPAGASAPFGTSEGVDFGGEGAAEDAATRVQALLDQGQQAFDAGDYQTAVDTWSRIYLIEADNREAESRIEEARRRREEVERRADHTFFEAREAFEQGQSDRARKLCQDVLELVPQHLEAHDLLTRLDTPAAPPPPPTTAPADEDDLFRDDFVPAPPNAEPGELPHQPRTADVAGAAPVRAVRRVSGGGKGKGIKLPPMPVLGLLGAVALLVLVVGFLLRSTLFGGAARIAESTLAQAEQAAEQGRLQEAINLLRSLQASEQLEGDVANQVSQRIVSYQRQLKSRAAPTPSVQLGPIREAIAAGDRVKALRMIREGLAKVPGDPELTSLEGEVQSYSSSITSLADAVEARDMDRVRGAAQAVLAQQPDDAEAQRLWRAATFNQAVLMLRRYEVGTAKSLLDRLVASGGSDSDIDRIRDFAERYVSKPVDPRYQIFVTNVELRPLT